MFDISDCSPGVSFQPCACLFPALPAMCAFDGTAPGVLFHRKNRTFVPVCT